MKAIRVNKYLMPVLVVLSLLGSVWVAKEAGLWQTSGRDQILLDESGQPDPAGIKGWMTLEEISEIYGLPLDALYLMIGAEAGVPPTPVPTPTSIPEPTAVTTEEHMPQGQGDGSGSGSGFELPQDGSRVPGSEIKGRMTLQEVVDYCQVPLEILVSELGLPGDVDVQLRMRDLAGQMGIEVQTVRDVVDEYQAGQ